MQRLTSLIVALVISCAILPTYQQQQCTGARDIATNADLSTITGCTTITGQLSIRGGEITTVSLPNLSSIGGNLLVDAATALTSISLPALTTLNGGGITFNGDSALQTINIPGPVTISSSINLNGAGALTSVLIGATSATELNIINNVGTNWNFTAPNLASITGNFAVTTNNGLANVNLPALASASGLACTGNPDLVSFTAAATTTIPTTGIHEVQVSGNAKLASFVFNPTSLSSFAWQDNGAAGSATTLNFDALASVGGSFTFQNNPGVVSVSFAGLRSVNADWSVINNAGLTTFSADGPFTVGNTVNFNQNGAGALVATVGITVVNSVTVNGNKLTSLTIPALAQVGNDLTVTTNDPLGSLTVGGSAKIGTSATIDGNKGVTGISLDGIASTVGALSVTNNAGATGTTYPFSAAGLTTTTGIIVTNNGGLASATFGSLNLVGLIVGQDTILSFEQNADLSTIHATGPVFTTGGDLSISNNPKLTEVILNVGRIGGEVIVTNNGWSTPGVFSAANLTCTTKITFAQNPGLKSVDLQSFAKINEAISFVDTGGDLNGCVSKVGSTTEGACYRCIDCNGICGNQVGDNWINFCSATNVCYETPTEISEGSFSVDTENTLTENPPTDTNAQTTGQTAQTNPSNTETGTPTAQTGNTNPTTVDTTGQPATTGQTEDIDSSASSLIVSAAVVLAAAVAF